MTCIGIVLVRGKAYKAIHQEKRRDEAAFLLGQNGVSMLRQSLLISTA